MRTWQREEDLFLIAQTLTNRLREAANNDVVLRFDPDTVFINDSRKVVCDTLPTSQIKNIREALYYLGVTLYHVATGKSEINDSALRAADAGYEPFDSDLWPLVELLLSGQAVNFKQVEELLIRPSRIKKLARKTKLLLNPLCWLITLIGQGAVSAFKRLGAQAGNIYPQTKKTAAKLLKLLRFIKRKFSLIAHVMLIIIAGASFICLASVNAIYFSIAMAVICGFLIVFFSFFLGVIITVISAMLTDLREDDCIFRGWIAFLILIASLSIYEIFETPTTGFCPPLVVIDRSSGNLIGRIADGEDKHYIPHYEAAYVNLFTKSYAPGILIQHEGIPVEAPLDKDKNGEKFCFWIKYAITDQATFESDWKRMTENKQTQADLEQELINAGQVAVQKALAESVVPIKSRLAIEQELKEITVEAKGADGTLSKNDYQVLRELTVRLVRNELLSRQQAVIDKQRRQIMDNIQGQLRQQFKNQYNYIEVKEPKKPGETAEKQTPSQPANPPAKVTAEQETE
ncbi:MAG: hypothetical protein WC668_02950 [Patescibacteria group bacterium]|jgi:hypothetical protein